VKYEEMHRVFANKKVLAVSAPELAGGPGTDDGARHNFLRDKPEYMVV